MKTIEFKVFKQREDTLSDIIRRLLAQASTFAWKPYFEVCYLAIIVKNTHSILDGNINTFDGIFEVKLSFISGPLFFIVGEIDMTLTTEYVNIS